MLIKNLFERDIFRPINGVVKADQLDDSSVWQELDEFVITKELDQHFRKFIDWYLQAVDQGKNPDPTGKMGIWISGFFGSGKSHFLKVLSYLLRNREHTNSGQQRFAVDFFDSKVKDPMLFGDIKRAVAANTDVILFNIDAKADHGSSTGRDLILRVFVKVLNELQGYSGDHPHIAHMERHLESKGKLQAFHDAYKKHTGLDWLSERDAYDAVVANPPYMGGKWMNRQIKEMARQCYPRCVADLFAMFIERGFQLAQPLGHSAMVAMQSWMFLASFEDMRCELLNNKTILSMAHLGPRAFSSISGEVVTVSAFACLNSPIKFYRPTFFRLVDGDEATKQSNLLARKNAFSSTLQDDFASVPGSPLVYWISPNVRMVFTDGVSLGEIAGVKVGLQTGNNAKFVRCWHEVSLERLAFNATDRQQAKQSRKKWFPYNKGGEFRRWYGNVDNVVDWENDGHAVRNYTNAAGNLGSRPQNMDSYFCEAASWSKVTTGRFALRYIPPGTVFDVAGCSIVSGERAITLMVLSLLNSAVVDATLGEIAPTMNFEVGQVSSMPLISNWRCHLQASGVLAEKCIALAKTDWDSVEVSWGFCSSPLCGVGKETLRHAWEQFEADVKNARHSLMELERQNSKYWIDAYGLDNELSSEVSDDQVTLYRPDREEDIKRLISYAIGCMMGR